MSDRFQLVSNYQPSGDQPTAIAQLLEGLEDGLAKQTLLGVTGSGKTFTMANIIARAQRPALILAPNKTLAAQLYGEMREFFPHNAVEYFVSYYDYYQPEAYVPASDTFIEKDASINEHIEQMRLSATKAILERRDTIVVASVSSIYGLGDPSQYRQMRLHLSRGETIDPHDVFSHLAELQYTRNDIQLLRGTFRVKGDVIDIMPAESDWYAVRLELFDDTIENIRYFDPLTGEMHEAVPRITIYPKTHYATPRATVLNTIEQIKAELRERVAALTAQNKLVEAQRLEQRTRFDLEMMVELGYCSGIENYSRYLSGREAGARSRKETLVDYGFRLPSALDNRPLRFEEFEALAPQTIYISATPGDYEREHSGQTVEQVVRPTGLLDPEVEIRPVDSQVEDILGEIRERVAADERVLITTLTKKMAEDLTDYLMEHDVRVRYIHSDVGTVERMEIIRDLRLGTFDVLVGINLLREGLDMPEVSLVAIFDADKEGFLRGERALIQTIGRAARNARGKAILYAAHITRSMQAAMDETARRREKQQQYNEAHGITPQTIRKKITDVMEGAHVAIKAKKAHREREREEMPADPKAAAKLIKQLEKQMLEHAKNLEFEAAAALRDRIKHIEQSAYIDNA